MNRKKRSQLTYGEMKKVEEAIREHIKAKRPRFGTLSSAAQSLNSMLGMEMSPANLKRVLIESGIEKAEIISYGEAANRRSQSDRITELEIRIEQLEAICKGEASNE